MAEYSMNEKYGDIRLFIWLIPCINIVNYYLTYTHFSPFWRLALTFTIDTGQGYIAWLLVRLVISWLDNKISYKEKPVQRILVQLVLTLSVGLLAIILLTELENRIAGSGSVPRSFYTYDIFIIAIWFFVVNGIYTGIYYYKQWLDSERRLKRETERKFSGVKVNDSKKELFFAFEEVAGFYIDGDYCVVISMENKKFLLDSSLDKIEKTLPVSAFYRMNRQYIMHRQVVIGYEKSDNGKINVLLREMQHFPVSIPVSRTRAPGFKSWMNPSEASV